MRDRMRDLYQKWDNAKLSKTAVFWVVVVAIMLTMYLGFSRAGWVTSGGADRLAENAAEVAVVERMAPICLLQFEQDPDKAEKVIEMQALSSTSRWATFIKAEGWATMPGEETPDNGIASACVELLEQALE